jgi:DNA-binding NtrC family response regulator
MAEKYKLPKITLTEEAKDLMLQYKWPGNVRELKNLTEQMSVLSEQREIDAKTLQRFIPQTTESTQLAVISKDGNHSYESERELLYKILYELRGNVSDLRRELNSVRKQMEEVRDLNGAVGFSTQVTSVPADHTSLTTPLDQRSLARQEPSTFEDAIAEEINEPETLNLNDLGRQMVVKALERNNGNRKKAAQELGISDRTLYRRLKQYGLEK